MRRTLTAAPDPDAFGAVEDTEVVFRALAPVSWDERAALREPIGDER